MCEEFFLKEHPSGEQGDIIFLDAPVYNKNIYLVTFASLHPEQLFGACTHSTSRQARRSVQLTKFLELRELRPWSWSCLLLPLPGSSVGRGLLNRTWGWEARAVAPGQDQLESTV